MVCDRVVSNVPPVIVGILYEVLGIVYSSFVLFHNWGLFFSWGVIAVGWVRFGTLGTPTQAARGGILMSCVTV